MKVHYVTGSRADFGLMKRSLEQLAATPGIQLSLIVTGQHLVEAYGHSVDDIEVSGLPIANRVEVVLGGASGAEMGYALSAEMAGCLDFWRSERPDLVLILGDRGEMVAAALAAVHLGIHLAHLHGGELSGTLDESFRHAISKLSHFHFVATEDSRIRLSRMGEADELIWVVGAPGLVGITDGVEDDPEFIRRTFGVEEGAKRIVGIFHPVVQEAEDAGCQVAAVLDLLERQNSCGIFLRPNSDSGGAQIDRVLDKAVAGNRFRGRMRIVDHLDRQDYLRAVANADLLLGNSSSGILESASLGTPCLNIGSRQSGRLRNDNVVDCMSFSREALDTAFDAATALSGPFKNQYGSGDTHLQLSKLIPALPLTPDILSKRNAY